MCDEWKNDFTSFYNWSIENGYSDNLTLDRINGEGNYEPSNCRWVSYTEQANNMKSNVCLTLNGLIIAEAVVLRNFRDDGAEIFGFAVAKEYFNQGYGTRLLQHLKEVAKEAGIKYFELTMNPDRPV